MTPNLPSKLDRFRWPLSDRRFIRDRFSVGPVRTEVTGRISRRHFSLPRPILC